MLPHLMCVKIKYGGVKDLILNGLKSKNVDLRTLLLMPVVNFVTILKSLKFIQFSKLSSSTFNISFL